jgi:hypothetical protein
MNEKRFKIILIVGLALCIAAVLVGLIGLATKHTFFCLPLIFGAGAALPVFLELYPLLKKDKKDTKKEE